MIKKFLFAAPLALAAGALFTTPASAADWNRSARHSEVTQVSHDRGHDRARHEFVRKSHRREHRHWRHQRHERRDRR